MDQKMISIPKKEYIELVERKKADEELLKDISKGIKDILQGKIKEI